MHPFSKLIFLLTSYLHEFFDRSEIFNLVDSVVFLSFVYPIHKSIDDNIKSIKELFLSLFPPIINESFILSFLLDLTELDTKGNNAFPCDFKRIKTDIIDTFSNFTWQIKDLSPTNVYITPLIFEQVYEEVFSDEMGLNCQDFSLKGKIILKIPAFNIRGGNYHIKLQIYY